MTYSRQPLFRSAIVLVMMMATASIGLLAQKSGNSQQNGKGNDASATDGGSPVQDGGIPSVMTYEGFVTDASGGPLTTGTYEFTFALYEEAEEGSAIWTEEHKGVQVMDGYFQVLLGEGSPAVPLNIAFDRQYYLGVQIGTMPEFSPRSPLTSQAYAFRARVADEVADGSITDEKIQSVSWSKITGAPDGISPNESSANAHNGVWKLRGNNRIDDELNYLGTNGPEDLVMKTSGIERMVIGAAAGIEISTNVHVASRVDVDETLQANDVHVADVNAGMERPDTGDDLTVFARSGNLRLEAGRVGVNESDPSATLDVGGDLHVRDGITASSVTASGAGKFKTLSVTENASVGGDVSVAGNGAVTGTLDVGSNSSVGGDVSVAGNGSVVGTFDVGSNSGVGGDLTVAGSSSIGGDVSVTGNGTVTGDFDVDANSSVGGDLAVDGALTVDDHAEFTSTVHISANVPGPATVDDIPDLEHHVMVIENTSTHTVGLSQSNNNHGLAINLNAPYAHIDRYNNFITFYRNGDAVSGRIEGLNTSDLLYIRQLVESAFANHEGVISPFATGYNPLNLVRLNLSYNPNWFYPGQFPTISFSQGSLPSASFSRGSLPSISFSKLTFSKGSLPNLTFGRGSLPNLSISGGALPSINGSPFIFGDPLFEFDLGTLNPFKNVFISLGKFGLKAYEYYKDPMKSAVLEATVALNTVVSGGGVTYESGARDYAEWLEREDPDATMSAGDIVGVTAGKISLNTENAEQIMAISLRPVVLGNMPPKGRESLCEKVAFLGQIPVKVIGIVQRGDFIIPSNRYDGTGIAIRPSDLDAEMMTKVVGRAWSGSVNEGLKFVNVAVGLQSSDVAELVRRHNRTMQDLFLEQQRVKQELKEIRSMNARMVQILRQLGQKEGQDIRVLETTDHSSGSEVKVPLSDVSVKGGTR